MNTNSNSYTIIYASVMVVIVAFLLAFVSSSLRETQNKNVELDTKKQILAALNIKDVKDAEAEYNKYVKGDMLMNVDGKLTENTGAFATAYEKEAKENIAENAKTAYNIAIAVLAVAILILEAYSAEGYNQSNCSASRFCSGSDYIQFYDKSDE